MATHLVQKPGESTWYVRMAVPADVRHAFGGRAKLIKTTGTSNKSEAMDRRLPILAQWKAQIAAAKEEKLIVRDQWRPELADRGLTLEHQIDARLLDAIKNPPIRSGLTSTQYNRMFKSELSKQGLESDAEHLGQKGKTELLRLMQETFESDPPTPIDAVKRTASLTRDIMVLLAEYKHKLSPLELTEARELIQNPTTYKPVSPITDRRLEQFRAYRVKDGIAAKTIDQQEAKLIKLSGYLRDQGTSLTSATIAAWLETLNLSSKTKAQYLLAGSTFWRWVTKNDARWQELYLGLDNPFKGQELPKVRGKAKADAARKAFTPEQIESLYRVAQAGGNQMLCDLILLGTYTGCRIEELAQLRGESVVKVEGVLSFKIDDSKTAAGIREIPVHPSLSTTVERLITNSTEGFLLPSSAGNKYGIRSDSLSKAFGRLKTAQGFGKHHVFHSVRKMVVTLLLRGGVPGPTVANIVGHETGLVTFDVYDEGASPRQKLDALSHLSFSFSASISQPPTD
ncbi:hypothetical protein BWR59_12540 [Pseudomonas sp. Bc-h]|uniref:tyrosine-type recombinase/integrase n=1 Tax=Pseudomonas sp. Bc-h TaxID=1943632 RepID=UPI0009D9C41C|nr:DUF6538 domain-containing protein [Pseudomonas sp. Bc-h]OQR32777.1 hypothetical protein BWR59_12540 [Pseudomonas sp. Bc-h]